MATMAREMGLKLAYVVEKYGKIPVAMSIMEFLEGERSYHANYLQKNNYLTVLELLFTAMCYIGLLPLWQSLLGQGPKGISEMLADAKYYVPG